MRLGGDISKFEGLRRQKSRMEHAQKKTFMPPGGGHHAERGDNNKECVLNLEVLEFHKFMKEGGCHGKSFG
jgi:hypothetical protein